MNKLKLTQTELDIISEAKQAVQVAMANQNAVLSTVVRLALTRWEGPTGAGWLFDAATGELVQELPPPAIEA